MTLHEISASNALSGCAPAMINDVRLVHWWVSVGEIEALNVLKQALNDNDITCDDTPISGGDNMLSDLGAMVSTGILPTAAVMTGHSTLHWAEQGVLGDISERISSNEWDALIPDAVQRFCKHNGRWIGVPVSLHSINWLWINNAVADKIGLDALPVDMDTLFAAMDLAKDAGVVPLSIGADTWLIATLFDTVVLSTNGPEFYNRAFMEFDKAALNSPEMIEAFRNLSRLAAYTNTRIDSERSWIEATRMVVEGQALLEVSGDWVRAEYRAAGKVLDTDYTCIRFPGTEGEVLFNADIFVMFDVPAERREAQLTLVDTVLSPAFQRSFNDTKGSAPVRLDVTAADLDSWNEKAIKDVRVADKNNRLIGSMAHGYAQPEKRQDAYFNIVKKVFNGEFTPEAAAMSLAATVRRTE